MKVARHSIADMHVMLPCCKTIITLIALVTLWLNAVAVTQTSALLSKRNGHFSVSQWCSMLPYVIKDKRSKRTPTHTDRLFPSGNALCSESAGQVNKMTAKCALLESYFTTLTRTKCTMYDFVLVWLHVQAH